MRVKTPVIITTAFTTILAMSTPSASQPGPYSGMVVFGTSLSDSGNAFALRGAQSTPPDYDLNPFLIPSAPYARGGHHFANGATWVEQFARSLGLAGSARPAFGSESSKATNYAVGAARACDAPADQNVNLADQVDAFLMDVEWNAPSDALYVIEMGGNDVRDAIVAALSVLQAGGPFPQAILAAAPILECARQAIQDQIAVLYAAGARNFLVWTVPDPGLTPAIRSLGPGAMQVAAFITNTFNTQMLLPTLQQLEHTFTDADIHVLDAFTLLHQMNARPADFGLTNTTAACVAPGREPYFCQAADEYLFWDGIHPTRAAHAIVAQAAARAVGQ